MEDERGLDSERAAALLGALARARGLGGVHPAIGLTQEHAGVVGVLGKRGAAAGHAKTQLTALPAQENVTRDSDLQTLSEIVGASRVGTRQDHGKLVAS